MVCGRGPVLATPVLVLLLLLLLLTSSGCQARHCALQASIDELILECAELLSLDPISPSSLRAGTFRNDADSRPLLRCVGISGRFWSDHDGLRQDVLARYFLADSSDTQNVNRTQACLNGLPKLLGSVVPSGNTSCDLAYESFLCFYHNYGNLHHERLFVPQDRLQLLHVTARCMELHRITIEDLMSLTVAELDENPSVHCLVRCIGIQTGIYSDRHGVDVDLIYAQFGEGLEEQQYKRDAYECLRRYGTTERCPCRRAYYLLYKCFENVRNVISEYELPDSDES